jgi:glutamyl-Q tRNA(Asp) synthetase
MSRGYRGRFAPSPTGPLHFGSLLAAFASWVRARQRLGAWLVRIEDLDPPREIPGMAEQHLRTLSAFGLESDEPVWRQSTRTGAYAHALSRLLDAGLAFECRCSRTDLSAQGGIHRRCAPSDPRRVAAIRARAPLASVGFDDALLGRYEQVLADEVGDFVLRRVDGWHAYQLAVVVDDAAQGIDEVVRGSDLLDSTPRQIWLQRALGVPTPHYLHLPLALDGHGRKLGKSLAALALDPRDPLPALRAAWRFLGQDPRALPVAGSRDAWLQRAIEHFDWARVPRQSQPVATASPV